MQMLLRRGPAQLHLGRKNCCDEGRFFRVEGRSARRSERVAKIRNQEGKGRERAAETGRSSRGERTIAELSACRYDEYAELRS